MKDEPYNIVVEVTTKKGEERLSFKSSNFTEADTCELMKLLLAPHASED